MSKLLLKYFCKQSSLTTKPENLIKLERKPHVHFYLQCHDYNSRRTSSSITANKKQVISIHETFHMLCIVFANRAFQRISQVSLPPLAEAQNMCEIRVCTKKKKMEPDGNNSRTISVLERLWNINVKRQARNFTDQIWGVLKAGLLFNFHRKHLS